MNAPDDALDPIIERADDKDAWIGAKQSDQEDREFDMTELQRLRAIVAAFEALADEWDNDEPYMPGAFYPEATAYADGRDVQKEVAVDRIREILATEASA